MARVNMKVKDQQKNATVDVDVIQREQIPFCILGVTPLFYNAMTEKGMREIILPEPKETKTVLQSRLRHDLIAEYRDSVYINRDDAGPTRLVIPARFLKAAICDAAIDNAGTAKAEIGRWTYVEGIEDPDYISVYGIPQLSLDGVRNSGIQRTPDVRSRAVLAKWACQAKVTFVVPFLSLETMAHLINNAGLIRGLGDWRVGKGKGHYGQFEVVPPTDPRWKAIVKGGGIAEQDAALHKPKPGNEQTERLLTWYFTRAAERGFKPTGHELFTPPGVKKLVPRKGAPGAAGKEGEGMTHEEQKLEETWFKSDREAHREAALAREADEWAKKLKAEKTKADRTNGQPGA